MMLSWVIFIGVAILSYLVQANLKTSSNDIRRYRFPTE